MIKRTSPSKPDEMTDHDMIKRVLAMSDEEVLAEIGKTELDPEAALARLREKLRPTSETNRKPG